MQPPLYWDLLFAEVADEPEQQWSGRCSADANMSQDHAFDHVASQQDTLCPCLSNPTTWHQQLSKLYLFKNKSFILTYALVQPGVPVSPQGMLSLIALNE